MATLALIRIGDEPSTIFAAVYPARGNAARARLSRRVSVYIFIKIVEYMSVNKNAMDFEKTYERETILLILISNLQQIFGNLLF